MKENNLKAEEDNKAINDNKKIIKNTKAHSKRGNSADPSNEKRMNIQEKPQIVSLITNLQKGQSPNTKQKNYMPSKNERLFSLSPNRMNTEKILPPKDAKFLNKKTLVLDLDETLVHSGFIPFNPSDIILKIEFENIIHDIHVLIRPGTEEFLQKMSKLYEIIIFTASVSKYADPLLDILDKEKVCSYRLFREHCTMINGIYVKNLKILNRDLKDTIIVDNSPLSYAFTPENGFPVTTWYDDKSDRELYAIVPLLEYLAKVNDIRKVIPRVIENNEILYNKFDNLIKIAKAKENSNKENSNNNENKINNCNNNNSTNINKEDSCKDNKERKDDIDTNEIKDNKDSKEIKGNKEMKDNKDSKEIKGNNISKQKEENTNNININNNNNNNANLDNKLNSGTHVFNQQSLRGITPKKFSELNNPNIQKNQMNKKISKGNIKEESSTSENKKENLIPEKKNTSDKLPTENKKDNLIHEKNKLNKSSRESNKDNINSENNKLDSYNNNITEKNIPNNNLKKLDANNIPEKNNVNKLLEKKINNIDKNKVENCDKGDSNIETNTINFAKEFVTKYNTNTYSTNSIRTNKLPPNNLKNNIPKSKRTNSHSNNKGGNNYKSNNISSNIGNINNINTTNSQAIKGFNIKLFKNNNKSQDQSGERKPKKNINAFRNGKNHPNNLNNINIFDYKTSQKKKTPFNNYANTPKNLIHRKISLNNNVNSKTNINNNISNNNVNSINNILAMKENQTPQANIFIKSIEKVSPKNPNNNNNSYNINGKNKISLKTPSQSNYNTNISNATTTTNQSTKFKSKNIFNTNKVKGRPMTNYSLSRHVREMSLKERDKPISQKNNLYRSPSSSQAVMVSPLTTTNQKSLKINLVGNTIQTPENNSHNNNKIESFTNNDNVQNIINKNLNRKNTNTTKFGSNYNTNSNQISCKITNRPNSTDKINITSVQKISPKTPKFNNKKLGGGLNSLETEGKRCVSNTSRHLERKTQIMFNNPTSPKTNKENYTNLSSKNKISKKMCINK